MKSESFVLLGIVAAAVLAIILMTPSLTSWEVKSIQPVPSKSVWKLNSLDHVIIGNQSEVSFVVNNTNPTLTNISVYLWKINGESYSLIEEKNCSNCTYFSSNFNLSSDGLYKINASTSNSNVKGESLFIKGFVISYLPDNKYWDILNPGKYLVNTSNQLIYLKASENVSIDCNNKMVEVYLSKNDELYNCINSTAIIDNNNFLHDNKNLYVRFEGINNKFRNNTITGFHVSEGSWNIFPIQDVDTSNKIYGLPIYWLINKSNMDISNAGMVVLSGCSDVTISNISIKNEYPAKRIIDQGANFAGIIIFNSSNIKIKDVNLQNAGDTEVFLKNVKDSSIFNCTTRYETGIFVTGENISIFNNTIVDSHDGGILGLDLNDSKIYKNVLSGYESYIGLDGNHNLIENNNILNSYAGVTIIGGFKGTDVPSEVPYSNIIKNNKISHTQFGISISGKNETIVSNEIDSCETGIRLMYLNNSFVRDNSISNTSSAIVVGWEKAHGEPIMCKVGETCSKKSSSSYINNVEIVSNKIYDGSIEVRDKSNDVLIKSNVISPINFDGIISSGNVTIENNKITSKIPSQTWIVGIKILGGNSIIKNNLIKDVEFGILYEAGGMKVFDNVLDGNKFGIYTFGTKLPNKEVSITNNNIFGSEYGIILMVGNVSNNKIHGNKYGIACGINENWEDGREIISISSNELTSSKELTGAPSINVNVNNNKIFRNSYGLYVYSKNGKFEDNMIFHNDIGVYLENSQNDLFVNNKIFGNIIGVERENNVQIKNTRFDSDIIGWNMIGSGSVFDIINIIPPKEEIEGTMMSSPLFVNTKFIGNRFLRPFIYYWVLNSTGQPLNSSEQPIYSYLPITINTNISKEKNIKVLIPPGLTSSRLSFDLVNASLNTNGSIIIKKENVTLNVPITNASVIDVNVTPEKMGYYSLKLTFKDDNNNTLIHYIPIFAGKQNKTFTSKVRYYLRFEDGNSYLSTNPPTKWEIIENKIPKKANKSKPASNGSNVLKPAKESSKGSEIFRKSGGTTEKGGLSNGNIGAKPVKNNSSSNSGIKPKEKAAKAVEVIPKPLVITPFKDGYAKEIKVKYWVKNKTAFKVNIPKSEKVKEKEVAKRGNEILKEQEDKIKEKTKLRNLLLEGINITNITNEYDNPSMMEINYESNIPILPMVPTPSVAFLKTIFENLTNISSKIDGIGTQEIQLHMPVSGTYQITYDGKLCDKNNINCNFTDNGIGAGQDFEITVKMGSEHDLNIQPYIPPITFTPSTTPSFEFVQNLNVNNSTAFSGDIGEGAIYTLNPIDVSGTGINKITIQTSINEYDKYLNIQKINYVPSCIIPFSNYILYEYISINTNIPESDISYADMEINVSNSWINNNNISNVYFIRCHPYDIFKANLVNKTSEFTVYHSKIPGFSDWAIVGTKNVTCPTPTNWSECINGKQNRTIYTLENNTCHPIVEEKSCLSCPVCPTPTDWKVKVERINFFTGKKSIIYERTSYTCSNETNYTCKTINETKNVYGTQCLLCKEPVGLCPIWWIIIVILGVALYFGLRK